MPAEIAFTISIHASNPLLQYLFKLPTAAQSRNPATSAAVRNSVAPPQREHRANSNVLDERRVDAGARRDGTQRADEQVRRGVSLNPPMPPLVKGVCSAAVIMMLSGPDARSKVPREGG